MKHYKNSPILDAVSAFQKFHLSAHGISEEEWIQLDKDRFSQFSGGKVTERELWEKNIGIPLPITQWQDSCTQVNLELKFRHFMKQINFFPMDVQNGEKSRPYLVSAMTHDIRAHTLVTDKEQCAIVFDNTILCLGQIVSYLFATLCYGLPQKAILSHPNYLVGRILDHGAVLTHIYAIILNVIHHGVIDHDEVMKHYAPMIDKNSTASKEIESGFISFMIGHEYSHLGMDHHTDTPNLQSFDREVIRKKILRTQKTYKKYSEFFEFPEIEQQIDFYIKHHRKELLADSCAFHPFFSRLCHSYSKKSDSKDSFVAACNVIGATLSIFIIDLFESSLRLISGGPELANCDLWFFNCDVDDICLRKKHPSPATRLDKLYLDTARSFAGDNAEYQEMANHFYSFFVNLRMHWMKWADGFDQRKSKIKVHDKWKANMHHHIFTGPRDIFDEYKKKDPGSQSL